LYKNRFGTKTVDLFRNNKNLSKKLEKLSEHNHEFMKKYAAYIRCVIEYETHILSQYDKLFAKILLEGVLNQY